MIVELYYKHVTEKNRVTVSIRQCRAVTAAQSQREETDHEHSTVDCSGIARAMFLFAGGMKLVIPIEEMLKQMPIPLPGWFLVSRA